MDYKYKNMHSFCCKAYIIKYKYEYRTDNKIVLSYNAREENVVLVPHQIFYKIC